MDRRRLLISIKGDKFNPEYAIFSGTCAAKTSNFGGTDTSILENLKVYTDKGIFVFRNNLWVLES